MASTITKVAHGLAASTPFKFANVLPTDSGVDETVTYYVSATNLTADTFEFSETDGGASFTLTNDIEDGDIYGADEYIAVTAEGLDSADPAYDARLTSATDAPMVKPSTRHVTHSWPEAPGQPQNFSVASAYKGLGARWDATSVGDLMFYEFRYAVDDGTGLAPATDQWVKQQVKTSLVLVNDLTIDTLYWAQVRSVDFSGQVVTSTADSTPVDYLANPEAGWTTAASVTPSKVPETDVAFNTVLANIVATNALDASTITTGLLTISTSDADSADGLRVYASGVLLGYWDETGLYISDSGGIPVDGDNSIGDLSSSYYVRVYDGGITVFNPTANGAAALDVLDSTGLNASAITRGLLPGAPNVLRNGTFEMADWGTSSPTVVTWTSTADFDGTQVSDTNVTNSDAVAITAGTGTYS